MNTNNIYYGFLRVCTDIKEKGNFWDATIESKCFKPVLVLMKRGITGKTVIKDLNTKERYTTELPLETGELFIKIDQMIEFSFMGENIPTKLSKKDVLKIGNEGLEEIREYMAQINIEKGKQKVKS